MKRVILMILLIGIHHTSWGASLRQTTLHDYKTERYYLDLDSNRDIERKMTAARLRGDQLAQLSVICMDIRDYYRKVIALNQANRHFSPKKIDADTAKYRRLLKELDQTVGCKK